MEQIIIVDDDTDDENTTPAENDLIINIKNSLRVLQIFYVKFTA